MWADASSRELNRSSPGSDIGSARVNGHFSHLAVYPYSEQNTGHYTSSCTSAEWLQHEGAVKKPVGVVATSLEDPEHGSIPSTTQPKTNKHAFKLQLERGEEQRQEAGKQSVERGWKGRKELEGTTKRGTRDGLKSF